MEKENEKFYGIKEAIKDSKKELASGSVDSRVRAIDTLIGVYSFLKDSINYSKGIIESSVMLNSTDLISDNTLSEIESSVNSLIKNFDELLTEVNSIAALYKIDLEALIAEKAAREEEEKRKAEEAQAQHC